jgi:hypothetical protein
MKINRDKVIYRLNEKVIMQTMHEDITTGLVGCLRDEYVGKHQSYITPLTTLEFPVFRAVVKMLASSVMQRFAEKIINEVIIVIKEIENDGR